MAVLGLAQYCLAVLGLAQYCLAVLGLVYIERTAGEQQLFKKESPGLKGVLVLKGTSDLTACQCLALLSTAWQCLALLSTSGLVSGGARGAMAPPKFFPFGLLKLPGFIS